MPYGNYKDQVSIRFFKKLFFYINLAMQYHDSLDKDQT